MKNNRSHVEVFNILDLKDYFLIVDNDINCGCKSHVKIHRIYDSVVNSMDFNVFYINVDNISIFFRLERDGVLYNVSVDGIHLEVHVLIN